jgi:hypothetical protein
VILRIYCKRSQLKDLFAVYTGTKNVTQEEFTTSLNILFDLMIAMRMTEMLEDKFLIQAVQPMLTILENNVNDLVHQSNSINMLVTRILSS